MHAGKGRCLISYYSNYSHCGAMVLYRVFSKSVITKYYSTIFSKATLFQVIVYCIIIIAPFFIAHSTNDFWQYTSTYREQANIHFINQWILQVTSDKSLVSKTWSTFTGLNRLLQDDSLTPLNSEIAIPTVKVREQDNNFDRVNDELLFTIEYSGLDYNITGIQGLLFFEISLNSLAAITLQGLIHFRDSWSSPMSQYRIMGDILIYQRDPLPASGRLTTYNSTLFNDTSLLAQDYRLINILQNYHQRNLSILMANTISQWETGTSGNFTATLTLTCPIQTLTYTPGVWQVIKFAWVQYLAILIVFYTVLGWVQSFVFQNQIVLTVPHRSDKKPHLY